MKHAPAAHLPEPTRGDGHGRSLPSAATLLLLTGTRPPSDAHARGDGVAQLAGTGVRTLDDLRRFLDSRLHTTGLVAAAVAAAAAGDTITLGHLDVLASARLPSPAARQASRRRGRQLLRVAASAWPSPAYRRLSRMPHHAVALGIVARVGGLRPVDAAVAAAYGAVCDPASAAAQQLGFASLAVQAVLTGLAPRIEQVATAGAAAAERGRIPAPSASLVALTTDRGAPNGHPRAAWSPHHAGTRGSFRSATASGNRDLIWKRQPRNIAGLP